MNIRIAKFISNSGYCSRREAEKLIEKNYDFINNKICNHPSQKVNDNDKYLSYEDLIKRTTKEVKELQKNYNVKLDFKKKFLKKHKKNKIFFKNKKKIIYFDLPNYVKSQVKLNKISKIDMMDIDTYDKKNNFFSARRSLRLKHDDYGRNISIIMIN